MILIPISKYQEEMRGVYLLSGRLLAALLNPVHIIDFPQYYIY